MTFRDWRLRRVIGVCALWILFVFGVLVERSFAFARQTYREHPSDDFYVVLVHLPGGLWTVLGPPVLLMVTWMALQRLRPAS